MARARALFITPAPPERTGNGLAMRLGIFLEALARVADTEVTVLPVSGGGDSALAADLGVRIATVPVVDRIDTNFRLLQMIADPAERLAAFRRYGRGSRHAALSLPVLRDVRALLQDRQFDLVHTGRLYLADVGLSVPSAIHTIDLDEDDAFAWRLRADLDREAGEHQRADWAEAEAEAEERLLSRIAPNVAAMFISSVRDRDQIRGRHDHPTPEIVPNGVDFPAQVEHRDDGSTVLFVGSLGYAPNVEGLLWFANKVLPRVLAHRPVRLLVVGRGHDAAIEQLRGRPGIELIGAVGQVAGAYAQATLAVAPLLSGAGTRIKLIEAAAFEVPFVATSIAAQGLDFGPKAYWKADAADEFAHAVLEALGSKEQRLARARRARQSARLIHDRTEIIELLARRFQTLFASADFGPVS